MKGHTSYFLSWRKERRAALLGLCASSLAEGIKLPSLRELARRIGVDKATVKLDLEHLLKTGAIERHTCKECGTCGYKVVKEK